MFGLFAKDLVISSLINDVVAKEVYIKISAGTFIGRTEEESIIMGQDASQYKERS